MVSRRSLVAKLRTDVGQARQVPDEASHSMVAVVTAPQLSMQRGRPSARSMQTRKTQAAKEQDIDDDFDSCLQGRTGAGRTYTYDSISTQADSRGSSPYSSPSHSLCSTPHASGSSLYTLDQPTSCLRNEHSLKRLNRRVQWSTAQDEVVVDLKPYRCIYGVHPSSFDFDRNGEMVPVDDEGKAEIEDAKAGDTIQCVAAEGPAYYSYRLMNERALLAGKKVQVGDRITLTHRQGRWGRDEIGYFPLFTGDMPMFALADSASSNPRPSFGGSLCPVMVSGGDLDDDDDPSL